MSSAGAPLRFKDLVVWQKAIEISIEVYKLVHLLPQTEMYGMRSQLTRATVSVAANIAEGWTRESRRDTAQFLAIAQGSLAEVETYIVICERLGWFDETQTLALRNLITEVNKMLASLRRSFRVRPVA